MTLTGHYNYNLVLKSLEQEGLFRGYASTYDIDQSKDQILPGAFSRTLKQWKNKKGRYPHLYWEHDFEEIIGLCHELKEDSCGLYIEGKLLLEIPKAQEVYAHLQKGYDGLSIGFFPVHCNTKGNIRQIAELDLKEISFVHNPCNTQATIHEYKNNILHLLKNLKKKIHY
jgi:HK97 family phage prohead protease